MATQQTKQNDSPVWQREGEPYVWMPYTQMATSPRPTPVVATEGVSLVLADGRRLIDGLASWWTACHGYNHPQLLAALSEQQSIMPHVMFGGIQHPQALRLAQRLAAILPGDLQHVFFCDSGSVSVEVAMKMAVQYWINQGARGRVKFLSFEHGYHGDTTGAMSLCDPVNSMHAHFKGFLLEQYARPIPKGPDEENELDAFLQNQDDLAGVVIEPLIQGAGGMKFHSPDQLAFLRRMCDRHNLLMIADEMATGFGRTGSLFACEQANVVPDIICLGKALTGGVISLACTVARRHVFDAFQSDHAEHALMHGPTYMANPLACAVANASLDLFETEPRLEQARQIETTMKRMLEPCRAIPSVVDVRCRGAVGVIQVKQLDHVNRLRSRFIDRGVWLRPFADMIYMTPPLVISEEDLLTLCEATVSTVEEWSTW